MEWLAWTIIGFSLYIAVMLHILLTLSYLSNGIDEYADEIERDVHWLHS